MSQIDIIIVPATPYDSVTVFEYLIKHYDFHVPDGPPKDWRVTEQLVKETIGHEIDSSGYHEAFHATDRISGNVLGQICYYKRFDFYYGKVIQVGQILVDEKYRGFQIGYKLMREVAKVAHTKRCLMTWRAWHWNVRGHKFYEAIGAKRISDVYSSNGAHHIHFLLDEETIESIANSTD